MSYKNNKNIKKNHHYVDKIIYYVKNVTKIINISFWKGMLLSTIVYIIYIEISPGLGNIWLRPNSHGNRTINFESLFNMMLVHPFTSTDFWKWNFIDLNWPVISFFSGLIFSYYHL